MSAFLNNMMCVMAFISFGFFGAIDATLYPTENFILGLSAFISGFVTMMNLGRLGDK